MGLASANVVIAQKFEGYTKFAVVLVHVCVRVSGASFDSEMA